MPWKECSVQCVTYVLGRSFSRLLGVAPKTSTHNPTHTYLTSPHQRRSDSQRGEIFSLGRQNHLEPRRITKPASRRRLFW